MYRCVFLSTELLICFFCADDSSFIEKLFLNLYSIQSHVLSASFSLKSQKKKTLLWERQSQICIETNTFSLSEVAQSIILVCFFCFSSHPLPYWPCSLMILNTCQSEYMKSLAQNYIQALWQLVERNGDFTIISYERSR